MAAKKKVAKNRSNPARARLRRIARAAAAGDQDARAWLDGTVSIQIDLLAPDGIRFVPKEG